MAANNEYCDDALDALLQLLSSERSGVITGAAVPIVGGYLLKGH